MQRISQSSSTTSFFLWPCARNMSMKALILSSTLISGGRPLRWHCRSQCVAWQPLLEFIWNDIRPPLTFLEKEQKFFVEPGINLG